MVAPFNKKLNFLTSHEWKDSPACPPMFGASGAHQYSESQPCARIPLLGMAAKNLNCSAGLDEIPAASWLETLTRPGRCIVNENLICTSEAASFVTYGCVLNVGTRTIHCKSNWHAKVCCWSRRFRVELPNLLKQDLPRYRANIWCISKHTEFHEVEVHLCKWTYTKSQKWDYTEWNTMLS